MTIGLISSFQAFAGEYCAEWCPNQGCDFIGASTLKVGAGYRQDYLRWAYSGFSPGTSIHEKWKDIRIGYIEANYRACFYQDFILKIEGDYGWSGWEKNHHVKLIDYNSRTHSEPDRSRAKAKVYDISVGFGREFCFDCLDLIFAPFVGWAYNHQHLRNQTFYENGHHSSKYAWNSGWLGFETTYQLCCPWQLYFDYAYHLGHYHAKIDEFFRDKHKGQSFHGNEFELGSIYQWRCPWTLAFKLNYKDYCTASKHSAYETYNDKKHSKRTEWDSFSVGVDLAYSF